jgi:RNA polymerase sigma-54 factor
MEPWEEENALSPETLEEHLLPQIALSSPLLEGEVSLLGERLLPWVDSRGYLTGRDEEIAEDLGISSASWREVLRKLQREMDPPGLLARNVQECLLLQLERRKNASPEALELLEKYADLLKEGKLQEIRRMAGWSAPQLQKALKALQELDPAPGSSFGQIAYVHPEMEVTFQGEIPKLRLLRENLPQLRVEKDLLLWREEGKLRRQWKDLVHLARCLALRCRGRVLVARKAVERQTNFLRQGQDAPGPLTLTEVARDLAFAPSTVQRIAQATWLRTPRGTLLLGSLFSRPLRSRPDLSVAQLRFHLRQHQGTQELQRLAKELGIPIRTLSWHRSRMNKKRSSLEKPPHFRKNSEEKEST